MSNEDITFIIQGEITPKINQQVAEIKKYFPQSKIIVSSCGSYNSKIFGADNIIVSKDPGFFYYSDRPGEKENNINRQIVNTLAGLKVCKTKYAFKLRSDFRLTGKDFLTFFNKYTKSEKSYKVFNHKILACSYFTRNPHSDMPFPFHPSDLAFFGETQDLIKLFDIPLMSKKEAYWDISKNRFNQYVPEQYLFINCLKKNGFKADCRFYNDANDQAIKQTEHYFASNFIFLNFEQFCLQPTKNTFSLKIHPNAFKSCYTHYEWLVLYKKFVDNTIELPNSDVDRQKIEKLYRNYKKYRFLSNLLAMPFRSKAKRREIRNKTLEFFLK